MASTSGSNIKKALDECDDPEPSKGEEVSKMSIDEMISRIRSLEEEVKSLKGLENEVKSMKDEMMRISPQMIQGLNEKVKENTEKIDTTLPYLVSQVIETSHTSNIYPRNAEEHAARAAVLDLYPRRRGNEITINDILTFLTDGRRVFVEFVIPVLIAISSVEILQITYFYLFDKAKLDTHVMMIYRILDNILSFVKNYLLYFNNDMSSVFNYLYLVIPIFLIILFIFIFYIILG